MEAACLNTTVVCGLIYWYYHTYASQAKAQSSDAQEHIPSKQLTIICLGLSVDLWTAFFMRPHTREGDVTVIHPLNLGTRTAALVGGGMWRMHEMHAQRTGLPTLS